MVVFLGLCELVLDGYLIILDLPVEVFYKILSHLCIGWVFEVDECPRDHNLVDRAICHLSNPRHLYIAEAISGIVRYTLTGPQRPHEVVYLVHPFVGPVNELD